MPDAARERSRWLDIERALGSYEAVLDDQEVDAVYVASTPQGGQGVSWWPATRSRSSALR
jgi:hypothetical protein